MFTNYLHFAMHGISSKIYMSFTVGFLQIWNHWEDREP